MNILQKLIINGGTSKEQGRFYDQADNARKMLPLEGKPPMISQKTSVARDGIIDVLPAILFGNLRTRVGKKLFSQFPTSASEANYPQRMRSGRR